MSVRIDTTADAAGEELEVTVAPDRARAVRTTGRSRGRRRLGPRRPARARGLAGLAPFPMAIADAYRDLLFHGPLFQGIVEVTGMDARGAGAGCVPRNRGGASPARTGRG